MKTPEIELAVEISPSECYTAAKKERYVDHTGRTRDVSLDGITVFTVNDLGTIHERDGNIECQGQDARISGEIIHQVVRLSQYKVEIRREKFLVENDRLETVFTKIKLPGTCKVEEKICVTDTQTFIFHYKEQCQLQKIRVIRAVEEHGMLVDHENKLVLKKGNVSPLPEACGLGQFYLTEYHDLYLTNASVEFEVVTELNLGTYINSRADYAAYAAEVRLAEMTNTVKTDYCNRRLAEEDRRDGKIFRLSDGLHHAVARGDVLSVFKCITRTEEVANLDTCFDRIPLKGGKWVNPTTRLLSPTANKIACDGFPMILKLSGGQWVQVGPGVQPRHPPPTESLINHQTFVHEDLSGGGLYTEEEMKKWQSHIFWGDFQTAIVETIAGGVCKHREDCNAQGRSVNGYDLNKLLPSDNIMSIWEKLDNFIMKYGGYAAFLVLGKSLIEMTIGAALLGLTWVTLGVRATQSLLQALCCGAVTSHAKIKRKMNKFQFSGRYHREDLEDNFGVTSTSSSVLRSDVNNNLEQDIISPVASEYTDETHL